MIHDPLQSARRALDSFKPLTAGDAFGEVTPAKLTPYVSGAAQAGELARVYKVARAVEEGRDVDPSAMAEAVEWVERQNREKTPGYRWASILTELPAFAGEFFTSGGAASAGKAAAKKGARKLIGPALREGIERAIQREALDTTAGKLGRKVAERLVSGGAAVVGGIGATVGRTAQFGAADVLLGGGRISASTYQRALPGLGLGQDEAGELAIQTFGTTRDFMEVLPEGVLDMLIEVGSEASGGALARLSMLDRTRLAQRRVTEWYLKKNPGGAGKLLKTLDKAGWQGPLEEYLEERAGTAARLATGLEEGGIGDIFPGIEQSLIELAAFAVPGVGIAAVDSGRRALQSLTAPEGSTTATERAAAQETAGPVDQVSPAPSTAFEIPEFSTSEQRARDIERVGARFSTSGALEPVEAETDEQRRAVEVAQLFGSDATLGRFEAPEEGVDEFNGASVGPNHIVLNADTADPVAVAYHEMLHQGYLRTSLEEQKTLVTDLERVAPDWLEKGRQKASLIYEGREIDEDALAEEGVAETAQALAGYMEWLSTSEGRGDLAKIAEGAPGTFRTLLDWIQDAVSKLRGKLPESFRASYARAQEMLGERPDQAAAEGALLFREFLGAAKGGAPASTRTRPRTDDRSGSITENAAKPEQRIGQSQDGQLEASVQSEAPIPEPPPSEAPKTGPTTLFGAENDGAAEGESAPESSLIPPAVGRGSRGTVELSGGRSRPVQYRIMEADDLIPSHDARAGFRPNEGGDLNERPYEDATEGEESRQTTRNIAESPRPALIYNTTPSPVDGPPITRPGGVVLGGNARAMGMQLAYQRGGEAAETYRQAAQEFAAGVGIAAEDIEGVANPVVVRELDEDAAGERGDLSRVLNEPLTTGKTLATEAVSRGRKIDPRHAEVIGDFIGGGTLAAAWKSAGNVRGILNTLVKAEAFTTQEAEAFLRPDGLLTQAGKEAFEQTLLGSVIPDVRTLAAMPPGLKQKVMRALPYELAAVRRDPEMGVMLRRAVDAMVTAREAGLSVDQALAQQSLAAEDWRTDSQAITLARGLEQSTQTEWTHRMRSLGTLLERRDDAGMSLFGAEEADNMPGDAREAVEWEFEHDQAPKFSLGLPGGTSRTAEERITDLAGTEHFRRWFGGSVVKTDRGEPVVMYHGTHKDPFTAFDPARQDAPAFFITPDPSLADEFATGEIDPDQIDNEPLDGARVLPVFVKAERPFRFDVEADIEAINAARAAAGQPLDGWWAGWLEDIRRGDWETIEAPPVVEAIKAAGFDSMYVVENGARNLGVFEPSQLKSALANVGTYDIGQADIRFALEHGREVDAEAEIEQAGGQNFLRGFQKLKGKSQRNLVSTLRSLRIFVQDQTLEIKEMQDRIAEETGSAVAPEADFYGQADLRTSKVPAQQKALSARLAAALEPFRGVDRAMERISVLLALKTAPDRNRWGESEGRGLELSGISDMEAYVRFNRERQALGPERVDSLLEFIRTENRASLDNMVDAGLILQERADQLHKREPYYVSLRDMAEELDEEAVKPEYMKPRKGLPDPLFKKAEGRGDLASDALLGWITDRYVRIDQAERNRALGRAEKLAVELDKIEEGVLQVVGAEAPADVRPSERSVRYYKNGVVHYVVFPTTATAKAIWGLNQQPTHLVFDAIGKGTQAFSRLVTSRNPTFFVPNFLRDSFQTLYTIAAEGSFADGWDVYRAAWRMLPETIKLFAGKESKVKELFEEAEAAGFKTTWADLNTATGHAAAIKDALGAKGGRAKFVSRVNGFLDSMSDAFETASRLAVYQHARENGATEREAALKAKNITVNFDRRGVSSRWISKLYSFFNPSIQGSTRILQAAFQDGRSKAITAGVMGMGALFELLAYAVSDEDETTGLPTFAMLSDYEKDRNIVFPVPVAGIYATIPLPYGLASIWSAGRRAVHMVAGDSLDPTATRGTKLVEALAQVATEFNPRGTSSLIAAATPSLLQPFMEVQLNENFYGGNIMKDATSFGVELADSDRAFSTITDSPSGWLSLMLADVLNLGGPEELPTGLDVSPESVQHVLGTWLLGGYGMRELERVGKYSMSKRNESLVESTPFLRNFASEVTSFQTSALYYEIKERAEKMQRRTKVLRGPERAQAIRQDPRAFRIAERVKVASTQLQQLSKRTRREGITLEQRRKIRDRMTESQARVVRAYYGRPRESRNSNASR